MLRPLSTLPLSNTAILELEKSGCHYVDDVENAAPELAKKYKGTLLEQVPGNTSALDLWQEELRQDHLTTFCDALDNILDGGLQCREITEISGAYGSGKSQICMQMSIITQLPKECGGLNSQSLYIDTRNGFSPTRIQDAPMGIRGLTTYVDGRRSELLEPYKLHGGYVVVDGENIAIDLYNSSRRPDIDKPHCQCVYGGDYNVYIRKVKEFFDNLEECNVTPLVILDGGWEEKKIKTLISRREDRIRRVMNYSPAEHSKTVFIPVNALLAFCNYLQQRQIKVVRCIFENDPCIAGIAKILNCPVLSADSDFFVFGTMYIPYSICRLKQIGFNARALTCSIFKVDNLLRLFPGLTQSVLPLVAVLMGSDYNDARIFQNFFDNLENQHNLENEYQPGILDECENNFIRKFDLVLEWLSKRDLNLAVAAILSTLPVQYRQKALESIELVVNGYLVLPFDMLQPLGFACENQRATCRQTKFSFPGNINTLEAKHYWRQYKMDWCANLDDFETEFPFGMQSDLGTESKIFADSLPLWFQQVYKNAELSSSFINMIFHRLYPCEIQLEDVTKPSAPAMCLNLIRVIDGLLVAGRKEAYRDFTYVIREGNKLIRHKLPTVWGINDLDFPPLSELPFQDINVRKRIFDETLNIAGKESLFEDIPPQWKLYIAAALYWIDPIDETPPNTCHIYALLFTMLLGVVEEHFFKYRALHKNKKAAYKITEKEINKVERIERDAVKTKQRKNIQKKHETNNGVCYSIIEALENVTENDCLLVANFFLNNCQTGELPSSENSHAFDVTIVHKFVQFQCCLKHAIYFNALLGYPYKTPVIEKLFNGTMLYNLYMQFEKHLYPEFYISKILVKTPSLRRLVHLLIGKMKMLVDTPIANRERGTGLHGRANHSKKKKNKKKKPIANGYRKKKNIFYEDEEMLNGNQSSSGEEQCDESDVECLKIYTVKARKLLNRDCALGVSTGKGLTKRKNKKKRSNHLCNAYGWSEDIALQDESVAGHRLRKPYSRFRCSDVIQSLE